MLFANYLPPSLVEFMTVDADVDDSIVGTKPKLAVGCNIVQNCQREIRALVHGQSACETQSA